MKVQNEDSFENCEALALQARPLSSSCAKCATALPLFFGYWKKYADLEFAIGGPETAELVYERGVSAIMTSVDLWAHYCAFKMETCHDQDIVRA